MKRAVSTAGVTWSDLEAWIEDYEKEFQVYIAFRTTRHGRALGCPMGLLVDLEVTGVCENGKKGWTRHYRSSWPTYTHKSMPGLFLYLLYSSREDLLFNPPIMRPQVKRPGYAQG